MAKSGRIDKSRVSEDVIISITDKERMWSIIV